MECKHMQMMLFGIFLLVWGCSGPVAKLPPQQVVAQVDSQAQHNLLQEQLLKQVSQVPKGDYSDYKIGPEDLLEVTFLDTEKLHSETRVNGEGEIGLLLVGNVKVAGLTPSGAAKKLADLYQEEGYLQNPQITVAVKEFRHQRVAVTGAVNKPDSYGLIGPRTLLEVIGMSGGLSDKAGEVAHIIRSRKGASNLKNDSPQQSFAPGTETIVVDLNRLLFKGETNLNFSINNGDVVFIPFAKTVYVLGSVAKPGSVFLKNNMTVTKAVAETGGLHIMLSSYNATLLRQSGQGQRETIPVNLARVAAGQADDPVLQENDIVIVQESGIRRFLFDFKMLLPGSVSITPAGMI